jgi:hypothetical protein
MYMEYPGYNEDPRVKITLDRCSNLDIPLKKKNGQWYSIHTLKSVCMKRKIDGTGAFPRFSKNLLSSKPSILPSNFNVGHIEKGENNSMYVVANNRLKRRYWKLHNKNIDPADFESDTESEIDFENDTKSENDLESESENDSESERNKAGSVILTDSTQLDELYDQSGGGDPILDNPLLVEYLNNNNMVLTPDTMIPTHILLNLVPYRKDLHRLSKYDFLPFSVIM